MASHWQTPGWLDFMQGKGAKAKKPIISPRCCCDSRACYAAWRGSGSICAGLNWQLCFLHSPRSPARAL